MGMSRCLSSCEVVPGALKRCMRAEHDYDRIECIFVEALNRADGPPSVITWRGPDAAVPSGIYHLHPGEGCGHVCW